ncbi:T6SS immunity protein Tdi1 domain-containing protein [Cellulomonas sp. NPDC089187]|uniref:T6SS immunity protein Tdi1 domain-containing protein n=1 Tax=Cellulomonas sp. NPDC089187 TaxID=3154970 RepID=UPI0034417791
MPTFAQFSQATPLDPAALERYAGRVPAPVLAAWTEHGSGLVGQDGYVRLLDPDHALRMLDGVIGMPETAVPVFITGMGDLLLWIEPVFHLVRFRWGTIEAFSADPDRLIADLQRPEVLDDLLERRPYTEAVARLGIPGIDQCFGYVPLLGLGGSTDSTHLDLGGLWEHLALIVHLTGIPGPRRSPDDAG